MNRSLFLRPEHHSFSPSRTYVICTVTLSLPLCQICKSARLQGCKLLMCSHTIHPLSPTACQLPITVLTKQTIKGKNFHVQRPSGKHNCLLHWKPRLFLVKALWWCVHLSLYLCVRVCVPFVRVLDEQPWQQRLGVGRQGSWELNLFHEDELEQLLVVLVVERQATAHHLVRHHTQTPPVHRPPIVVVLQYLMTYRYYLTIVLSGFSLNYCWNFCTSQVQLFNWTKSHSFSYYVQYVRGHFHLSTNQPLCIFSFGCWYFDWHIGYPLSYPLNGKITFKKVHQDPH